MKAGHIEQSAQVIPRSWAVRLLVVVALLLLQACASPADKLTVYASSQGFQERWFDTGEFKLLVFDNDKGHRRLSGKQEDTGVLHVYLEGDGSPWRHRVFIMADPTPRSPIMLRLMALDSAHAVYVGRPCYNGTSTAAPCDNSLWTSGRYSERVVSNMSLAIRTLAKRRKATEVWLFGHSGGGTLAMLLAARLDKAMRVVTIAGNLDTDAWTEHHNYTRLFGSANPAQMPALDEHIEQWHLLGEIDSVIPPMLVQQSIARQPAARRFLLPGYGHGCCWERIWPTVLDALKKNDPAGIPGYLFSSGAISASGRDNR
ncbi:MAG: alpha/beta hydrolase [Granulosicoccus sp.]